MGGLPGSDFVDAVAGRRRSSLRLAAEPVGGVRFAFYGRMPTSEFQDRGTSRAWQRAVSEELVEGVGSIVADYFDEGRSRRWSWWDRPAASALLAAAEGSDREFDAVVVGEYERAFYGDQFREVVARLNGLGVQVWLPEAGGPVELDSPIHAALMVLLGAQAQREVVRARHRVKAAMAAQARSQGRFLGGCPPYGYRLADGGPHPNVMHAQCGRRVHVLEPDPATAPWVRWMFAERVRGRSASVCWRGSSTREVCRARPMRIRPGIPTGRGSGGSPALLAGSWRIRGIRVGRSGTGRPPRATVLGDGPTAGVQARCVRIRCRAGKYPSGWLMHRWLMRRRLSLCSGCGRRDLPRTVTRVSMCWPGWWSVVSAVVGWMRTGCTAVRGIAAAMATPPPHRIRMRRPATSMSVRTISAMSYRGCSASKGGNYPRMLWGSRSVSISPATGWKSCAVAEAGSSSRPHTTAPQDGWSHLARCP